MTDNKTKAQIMAEEYLNVQEIKYDPDFQQIFGVHRKYGRYPLVYTGITRIIGTINENINPTKKELEESKRLIVEFIIKAIEEKLERNANINGIEKSSK